MAARLGISPTYVNLLEANQRSLSVPVLLALTEAYGIDMRSFAADREVTLLADLRAVVSDPAFAQARPDLQELRAAVDHAPKLIEFLLQLHRSHRGAMQALSDIGAEGAEGLVSAAPETAIHDFFRGRGNHFPTLEEAATHLRARVGGASDDMYALLKRHLRLEHGITVEIGRASDLGGTLRSYEAGAERVVLSEALDHPNRIFQMAHVIALVEAGGLLDDLTASSGISGPAGRARCRVELANYFAAAVLMPYDPVLTLAERTGYDVDLMAAAFGTSFEQVCQRLTTLGRDGARGVPFFFLRLDKAGNVTKRFNATPFTLAEKGGSCPVWNIHDAFRQPGVTLPQLVEMPDGGQFFTISRTSDRPVFDRRTQDRRIVVALGCDRAQAHRVAYAREFNLEARSASQIGISCTLCPRQNCAQRAHLPVHTDLPIDANRRGSTRYES